MMPEVSSYKQAPERRPAQIRHSPTSHCRRRLHLRVASIIGSLIEFGMVNVITALRIYALYGQSKCGESLDFSQGL
jgi:hypothetical protein